MKKINIVLPVYNEEDGIENFNSELFKVLNQLLDKYYFEVIYVVDKCKDNTLGKLTKLANDFDNITIISLSSRFGHQMSLVAGIDNCDGDAAIMMDCDLEHPPRVIIEMLDKFEEGFEIVHTRRKYNKNVSVFKKIPSNVFYNILNMLSENSFVQGAADFRLISKEVIDVFRRDIREHNQFLRGLFQWVGFNQTYIDFESATRESGTSKYNIRRLFNFAINGIMSFSKMPLKISIFIGIIFSGLSIAYGLYSILALIIFGSSVVGWTSMISVVSFIGGLQLIVLGIIGLYIGEIFDEVKNRPLYVIRDKIEARNKNMCSLGEKYNGI